ncbi:hypothetical protein PVAND_006187 [Polypedilum vanderplanki]|uniref:Uncharacterized protein n=1 Tax=Polypedilum vanderplanki TaxID=319348 RepID=A0A9J6C2E1_POLVA|nr:hypothetical protein PVAND_006187 [Polypedilum vanderplanki]
MYQVTASQTEQNIKLIACVKRQRCLYDHNDQNYKNSVYVDKGWQEVSKEFGESVSDCKKKWRHLRSSLSRYLKSSKDLSKNKNNKLKPYYLLTHMDFLVPYTKTLESKLETMKYEPSDNNENFVDMKSEEEPGYDHEIIQEESQSMEEDEDIVYEAYEIQEQGTSNQNPKSQITLVRSSNGAQNTSLGQNMPQLQPLINTISTSSKPAQALQLNASQISQINSISPQPSPAVNITTQQQQQSIPVQQNTLIPITDDQSSADLNFFLALLPDVKNLNHDQKRKLRIGILKLIDDLMTT